MNSINFSVAKVHISSFSDRSTSGFDKIETNGPLEDKMLIISSSSLSTHNLVLLIFTCMWIGGGIMTNLQRKEVQNRYLKNTY